MASASDDFNRADGGIGANWTQDSGVFTIVSNTCRQTTGGGSYRKARYTATTPATNDYTCGAVVRSSNASIGAGTLLRGANASTVTGYSPIGFGGDAFYMMEITAGAEGILDTGSAMTANTSYTLLGQAQGTALTATVNGVADLSATDGTLTSGGWGLMCFEAVNGANDFFDTWQAADLSAGAPVGPLIGGKLADHSILQGRLVR